MTQTYLRFPAAPNLPLAPEQWDRRYQDQFANVLRLYFNLLSGALLELGRGDGGYHLSFPYGAFSDSTSQTAVSTTAAYPITLNTTDFSSGVTVVGGSKITVSYAGIYNLQFSVQMQNLDNAPQDIEIWARQNGTDIPNSNSRFGLAARKSAGVPFHIIGSLNLFLDMNAGDYVELVWNTTHLDTSIAAYAAGTTPTRPAVPSVITTVSFVSAPPA
jgi:hypothetical protein